MSWEAELEELRYRQQLAYKMGGEERVARQHAAGRLTVRERIDRLLDKNSFHEIGAISGFATYDESNAIKTFTPANCVFGRGLIDARQVVVAGDDFTIRGGSADASIWAKFKMAENMAYEFRMPLVRMVEGSGGGGSVRTIETTGRSNLPGGVGTTSGLDLCARNLGQIPVVSIATGPVAGLAAARFCASHFAIMIKEISSVFVAGPPVVEHLGQKLTKEELGGHKIHTKSGVADYSVDNEDEAFVAVRRFLSYLPSSVWELPPRTECHDDPARADEFLISAVPKDSRKAYKIRQIIESVVDSGSFFEIAKSYGPSIVTGFARLNGWPVAIMAGDPYHSAGVWTANSAQKITRFVDLAETFHLPVVHLVDCPGFEIGLDAEKSGVMRQAVRAIAAINQTTVPWCSVLLRNVFGVGGGAHQPAGRLSYRYAWPSGRWGSLPLEGGVEAAYSAELAAAENREEALAKITSKLSAMRSPFRTAEAFWIEEIIDPRDTRRLLCEFADTAAPLRTAGKTSFTLRP
ncbi:MAG: methylmalonyl-CoA carboxyltransferase [Alphaproteobacteria bacterium]|nr:methylmalonyl-CoA carboxyltransferase [Alphaproteobacteria bacterium]